MQMQANDIFTLDQAAIDELKLEGVSPGQQYRITQEPNSVEIRGSKVGADGKPQKGRPRRFPATLVARLMGQPVPTAAPVVADTATATETATATATAEATQEAAPAEAVDDAAAQEKREALARALNPSGTTTEDW
jgi:hypothetical protein